MMTVNMYGVNDLAEWFRLTSWNDLCFFSIKSMKLALPIWNKEVKKTHFVYCDHVCGMRHRIAKKTLDDYVLFLEKSPKFWGDAKATRNSDLLELWVAATDLEFPLSRKAFHILMAGYSLMSNIGDATSKNGFVEVFASLSQAYTDWDSFSREVLCVLVRIFEQRFQTRNDY